MNSFKESEKCLSTLGNEATKRNYVRSLFVYCQETGASPSQLIQEKAKAIQNPNLRGLAEDSMFPFKCRDSIPMKITFEPGGKQRLVVVEFKEEGQLMKA